MGFGTAVQGPNEEGDETFDKVGGHLNPRGGDGRRHNKTGVVVAAKDVLVNIGEHRKGDGDELEKVVVPVGRAGKIKRLLEGLFVLVCRLNNRVTGNLVDRVGGGKAVFMKANLAGCGLGVVIEVGNECVLANFDLSEVGEVTIGGGSLLGRLEPHDDYILVEVVHLELERGWNSSVSILKRLLGGILLSSTEGGRAQVGVWGIGWLPGLNGGRSCTCTSSRFSGTGSRRHLGGTEREARATKSTSRDRNEKHNYKSAAVLGFVRRDAWQKGRK